ncbi:hypothetical protein K491DRAFT_778545 [Lophiostoma macrostomum CBS 122681]|uniref:Peptidase S8/S53 domain-containing protein n=1 Tax=Lophiostoma macrostomum CBS 122681 TaxID=1314788 RepID=A0A6A6T6V1_9PLEO|nr:hypothetical protein K491DRAFT_778545 [Lophiostoma macrostomum CBS 122681]
MDPIQQPNQMTSMKRATGILKLEGLHRKDFIVTSSKPWRGKENTDSESSDDEAKQVAEIQKKIVRSWIAGNLVDVTHPENDHALLKVDQDRKNLIHRAIEQLRRKKREAPEAALTSMASLVVQKPELFVAEDIDGKTPLVESAKHQPEVLFRVLGALLSENIVEKLRFRCRPGEKSCPLRSVSEELWRQCRSTIPGSDHGSLCVKAKIDQQSDELGCLHDDTDVDKLLRKHRQLKDTLISALRKPLKQDDISILQLLLDERRFDAGQNSSSQLIEKESFRTLLHLCPDEIFVHAANHGYSPLQKAVSLFMQESLDLDLLNSIVEALIDRYPPSVFFCTKSAPSDKNAYRMLRDMKTMKNAKARAKAEENLKRACVGFQKEGTAASLERLKAVDSLWLDKKNFLYWDPKAERDIYLNLTGESEMIDEHYIQAMVSTSALRFETGLEFVRLPYWKPEGHRLRKPAHHDTPIGEPTSSESPGDLIASSDPYITLFEWLWKCNVCKIFTLEVEDDGPEPHTNAAIRQALRGSESEVELSRDFGIEVWKWKKFDICSETVIAAAPNARHVYLYSHGNTAVLRGWGTGSDWSRMKQLQSLTIEIFPQNRNDDQDCTRYEETLKIQLAERCRHVHVNNIIVHNHGFAKASNHPEKRNTGDFARENTLTTNEDVAQRSAEWINKLSKFTNFIDNIGRKLKPPPSVKVAILDDGANLRCFRGTTVRGRSFRADKEEWFALKWALDLEVDIISMSWTFDRKRGDDDVYGNRFVQLVKTAIASHKAVFFGSLSDQGVTVQTYDLLPAGLKGVISIGSATMYGDSAPENRLAEVDFLLPGENLKTAEGKVVKGSSFATAYASGLAAMALFCIKSHIRLKESLSEPEDDEGDIETLAAAKTVRGMKSIFARLSQKHPDDPSAKGAFVRPYVTFGHSFRDSEEGRRKDLENIVTQMMPLDGRLRYRE